MYDPSLITKKKVGVSILYVEDEENIRNVLTKILLRKFSEVLSASSGAEGLRLYLEKRPDIVITDIRMPDMSGIEMSRRIREINPEALIVVTTAFTDVEHFLDAISLGINRFIIKPIDSQKLEATIHELLETVKKRHEFDDASRLLREYRRAVDCSVIVSKTDRQGVITYVNEAFCDVSGYSQQELMGKPHNIVRHPLSPKRLFEEIWSTILTGRSWKGRIKNQKKGGGSYTLETTIVPISDSEGEILEFIALCYDITELLAIQEAMEQMRISQLKESIQKASELRTELLLGSIPHPAFVIDTNDQIVGFNKHAEALFGLAHKKWHEKLLQKKLDFKSLAGTENPLFSSLIDWKQLIGLENKGASLITLRLPSEQSRYILGIAPLEGEKSDQMILILTPLNGIDSL